MPGDSGGPGTSEAFTLGGSLGIAYQLLLQMSVDSIPGSSDYQQVCTRRSRSLIEVGPMLPPNTGVEFRV